VLSLYVVGVPSLPGVVLDADTVFTSLSDPALTGWANLVGKPLQPAGD